ncbi:conserved hypothetical protein [Neospora caninum Liverpool]|uniref:PI31 proteasome regulator C-terminal domain-containing protein n=1 Tax=Neospora caninum (strain Liverpool) TaxID=572307 RepID=F0VCY9_NEOCL|nr:conserved hypothetical protein [Neospora caninum Liverpool]CBZ51504.1 conserved hypothetical protein [Neospora caninum Liverpool]CEL65454.1 TPA: hypothetical protein BN1204_012970 [Neospora caninum Liverpool]|eukprot:XP_003881537.1 conserved hypothetical protein [Neospora caninum Liverpool]
MTGPTNGPVAASSPPPLGAAESDRTHTLQSLLLLKTTLFRDAAEALTLVVHAALLDSGFVPLERGARTELSYAGSQGLCSEVNTPSGDFVRLPDGRVARVVYTPAAFSPDETGRTFSTTLVYALPRRLDGLRGAKKPEARVQVRCAVVGHVLAVHVSDEARQEETVAAEFPLEAAKALLELDARRGGGTSGVLSADAGEEKDAREDAPRALPVIARSVLAAVEDRLVSPLVRAYAPPKPMDPTASESPAKPAEGSALPPPRTGSETTSSRPPVSPTLPAEGPSVGAHDLRPPGLPDLTRRPEEGFPLGLDEGDGGTHVGPRHPFFRGGDRGAPGSFPMPPLPPGFVPGARYDPIGPFGVEPNPDHERPQRWDNRGDLDPPGGAGFGAGIGGIGNFGGGRGGGGGFGGGII